MDWVQIYSIVFATFVTTSTLILRRFREGCNWYDSLYILVPTLPLYGRIFGWW